jgi:hypothetical protein
MAAANESQGLKIAVAAFVTLTVVLAVATYLAYSSYSEASAKLADAESKLATSTQEYNRLDQNLSALKQRAGYGRLEEFEAVTKAIDDDNKKLEAQLAAINDQIRQTAQQYQQSGGDPAKVTELVNAANQLTSAVTSLPAQNRTFVDVQARLLELLGNTAQLSEQYALDNEGLRTSLKTVDQANAAQLQVQIGEVQKAKDDLAAEHDGHERERQDLLRRYDELQTLLAQKETELSQRNIELESLKSETDKQRNLLLANLRQWREQVEKKEDVMDVPDGKIVYVDNTRGEVRTDVRRSQGAKERMQLAVFDKNSPGLPTDKPKGVIELIQVTESGSIGRIVSTRVPSDPIRGDDLLYSAAWSPNKPERFALVGKIDVNRDGRDDRADLIRMIRAAGGEVAYDLPPTGAGSESGQLDGSIAWYVLDDKPPIRNPVGGAANKEIIDQDFISRRSEALENARLNGVRPIALDRLLAYLGYRFGTPVAGQVEAIDEQARDSLLQPGGVSAPVPQPTDSETPPSPDAFGEPEPAPAAAGAFGPGF